MLSTSTYQDSQYLEQNNKLKRNSQKVLDIPIQNRPRERLAKLGGSHLSDAELVAILLGTGIKDKSIFVLANRVLQVLSDVPKEDENILYRKLIAIDGIGPSKASILCAGFELARRRLFSKPLKIYTPKEVYNLLFEFLGKKKEYFIAVYLNYNREFVDRKVISVGCSNRTYVDSKDIFQEALKLEAYMIILAHNHPSGNIDPSPEDINTTRKLSYVAKHLGIKIIDHLIISKNGYFSFFQNGLIKYY